MPLRQLIRRLGITVPVFQAPIGAIASAQLAAAISEAGSLGHLACTWHSPDQRDLFREIRLLTKRPSAPTSCLIFRLTSGSGSPFTKACAPYPSHGNAL
jgi:NAD(P)H-dependent flavin oxidoreductase YrpB (nitropropane dioxygenase family)